MRKVMNVVYGVLFFLGFLLILGGAGRIDTDATLRLVDVAPQMLVGIALMIPAPFRKEMCR